MYTLLLFFGIILWPEMAFCVFLFTQGYIFLAIVAALTTFGSGSRWVSGKINNQNTSDESRNTLT